MKETWYFLDSGEGSPAYNMALDEALLNWQSEKLIPPTLRFYTWEPSTLSVGYFQRVKEKINLDGVRKHGLGLVRRLTGGRAVLHDQELTYSVVVSEDHPRMPKTVTEAYRVISEGILQGFRELGLEAEFAIPTEKIKQSESAVCFDQPSWYELVVSGRKAAGSAQTRQKGVILQHGAIPLDIDADKLFDLFVYPSKDAREKAQEGFDSKAVAINLLRSEPVSLERAKHAFHTGFEKGLDIDLKPFVLSEEQEAEVRKIAESRYANDDWTYLR
ncbi:MAG TPA: biotin/lipoate A/B protein ligase family protein [Bacillales bacterium]|nr:biotin/lipoate A/B protein ligase family protein [Bacillales bacterium]